MDEEAAAVRLFRGERFERDGDLAEPWVIHRSAHKPQSARDRTLSDARLRRRLVAMSTFATISSSKKDKPAQSNRKEIAG